MNTFALKVGVLALCLLVAFPTGASAFKFVDSTATRISDTAYLLTYTYTAGFLNTDAFFPIVAMPVSAAEVAYPVVSFSVLGSEALTATARVHALVLSQAPIVDGQYQAMAGSREQFTLMALVSTDVPVSDTEVLAAQLRTLPFAYEKDGQDKTGLYEVE